jgi:hypothetical protein
MLGRFDDHSSAVSEGTGSEGVSVMMFSASVTHGSSMRRCLGAARASRFRARCCSASRSMAAAISHRSIHADMASSSTRAPASPAACRCTRRAGYPEDTRAKPNACDGARRRSRFGRRQVMHIQARTYLEKRRRRYPKPHHGMNCTGGVLYVTSSRLPSSSPVVAVRAATAPEGRYGVAAGRSGRAWTFHGPRGRSQ